ncbi:MAG: hypothetical protein WC346_20170 [Methanogenium sp.]|jgi:hypothetical protein
MARIRLYPNHPMVVKLNKIFDLMADLKIHLSIESDEIYVTDETGEFPTCRLVEADDGQRISELPPAFEHKLTYEKDLEVSHG